MLKLPRLTLVTGGAASGKSAFAEGLVRRTTQPKVYLATAQIWDDEMAAKVAQHRQSRGEDWQTIDTGLDIAAALAHVSDDSIILLDCVTMWLNRVFMEEADFETQANHLLSALATSPAPIVAVTNEVGQGIVPETPLGRQFRNAQGQINQRIAAQADWAIAVMSGLPLRLKGDIPGDAF